VPEAVALLDSLSSPYIVPWGDAVEASAVDRVREYEPSGSDTRAVMMRHLRARLVSQASGEPSSIATERNA
jgi:hypothetical protein